MFSELCYMTLIILNVLNLILWHKLWFIVLVNMYCTLKEQIICSCWVECFINVESSWLINSIQNFSAFTKFLSAYSFNYGGRDIEMFGYNCRFACFFLQSYNFWLHVFWSSVIRWINYYYYIFLINYNFYHYEITFYISGNIFYSEICFV